VRPTLFVGPSPGPSNAGQSLVDSRKPLREHCLASDDSRGRRVEAFVRARRPPVSKTPGRTVDCVNCTVERLFEHAPVLLKRRPLIVKRGTLIVEVGARPAAADVDE